MESFHQALAPICATIQDHPFLGGSQPNFADFAVAGAFVVCTVLQPFAQADVRFHSEHCLQILPYVRLVLRGQKTTEYNRHDTPASSACLCLHGLPPADLRCFVTLI